MKITVFEYLYRDAGNYKAYGMIPVSGVVGQEQEEAIQESLICGVNFVAEDVGIPTLYEELWKYSDGPTDDDHGYHEYVGFRQVDDEECADISVSIDISDLVFRFVKAAEGSHS